MYSRSPRMPLENQSKGCQARAVHPEIPIAVNHDQFSEDASQAAKMRQASWLVQMASLLSGNLSAMLDLVDFAGGCLRVKHHHIKFTRGELKMEDLSVFAGCLRFQQHDVFFLWQYSG